MNVNLDTIRGNWRQIKGEIKQQWGKLTDDDMALIEGHRDELVGKVQERYGLTKDAAEREVAEWARRHDGVGRA